MTEGGKPKQYRGRLSVKEIAYGMNAAARNSRRLLSDAELLLENERFPLAASIAILAIEEAGKVSVLRNLSIVPDDKTLQKAWKDYRNHQAKNAAWIILDLVKKGARTLGDLRPIFDPNSDHPVVLDSIKQIGFYTDSYGERHWSEPHEIVDAPLAHAIVTLAKVLCPRTETSAREIELWIQHVAPHWGTRLMGEAAYRFHQAMEQEGLSEHTPDEVRKFFGFPIPNDSV